MNEAGDKIKERDSLVSDIWVDQNNQDASYFSFHSVVEKSFFENIYNPALTNEVNWLALDKQYSFNVIYFYRRDMTDNAQSFLYRRTQDPQWVPIYVDDFILILIKNEVKNKKLIEKYGLAKEIFTQSKN